MASHSGILQLDIRFSNMNINKEIIAKWFRNLQDDICLQLEEEDGKGRFIEDKWERKGGGGGASRVLAGGRIIEKGGVNFSAVHGETPYKIQQALNLPDTDFYATGVSIVLHPLNPYVPIIHMNVRYFETFPRMPINSNAARQPIKWWFGGGIDLTPHYVDKEDAAYFHQTLKKVCDRHDKELYMKFKKWADDYFFIRHRNETRGIGGIFFDQLNETSGKTREEIYKFVQHVGSSFAPLYRYFMKKNSGKPYGEREKNWQYTRRGRYVEFNLVYDKGTKFGLDTNGRTESILMSLPPMATWHYNQQPEPETEEHKTLQYLKKGVNWV